MVPPAVAGIGLLAALGPEGLLGGTLEAAGVELVFQTAGVMVALVFVASPFYIRQALAAFAALDHTVIEASRTLGAGDARTFLRVALPDARAGPGGGRGAGVGPRARRVRRHARVRRQPERASPRPRRWPSTSASRTTSPARWRCRRCWWPPAARSCWRSSPPAASRCWRRCSRLRSRRGSATSSWTPSSRWPPGSAWRWRARRAPARARCCAWRRDCCAPSAGSSAAARARGWTPSAGIHLPPERAAGRLPVPGLRAVRRT